MTLPRATLRLARTAQGWSVVEPLPFADVSRVSVAELVEALAFEARRLELSPVVQREFEAFCERFDLAATPALFGDFVRVRMVFEATRDGGLWHLRWTITHRNPNSKAIWSAFGAQDDPAALPDVTADAECDELSALFAVLVRRLGVDGVGLFWPTGNHVVAVWTIERQDGGPVRVVIPTSQIFLGADEGLGTRGFNPWRQRTIFTYRSRDVSDAYTLPAGLARAFVLAIREHGDAPADVLQQRRNERAAAFGGS